MNSLEYSPNINNIDKPSRLFQQPQTKLLELCLHYVILCLFDLSSSIHLLFHLSLFQSFDCCCCLFSNNSVVTVAMILMEHVHHSVSLSIVYNAHLIVVQYKLGKAALSCSLMNVDMPMHLFLAVSFYFVLLVRDHQEPPLYR